TSYGIIPTPPSPTQTSPSLTQSTSNSASNSSSSPPEPMTPPSRVSRSRTRYPDLGRVPLHRRGNSKTYERLEDLLREAGYKETRVFTPETERAEAGEEDRNGDPRGDTNRLSMKDGMDAVVGFLAGFMPGAVASKASVQTAGTGNDATVPYVTSPQEYSPPASPLAHRQSQKHATGGCIDITEPPTPTTMTSSIDSLGDPTPRASRVRNARSNQPPPTNNHSQAYHYPQRPPMPGRNSSQASHASQQIQKQPSRGSLHHQPYNSNIVSPRPSRAGAYLRHMASASSMPPRPNSTPAAQNRPTFLVNDSDSDLYSRRGNGEGEEQVQPPLPPTWLESVARAVLFGGTGAYIGRPSTYLAPPAPASTTTSSSSLTVKPQALRSTRSSLSQVSARKHKPQNRPPNARNGLSDQTNTTSNFLVPPPFLFSQIERGRSGRSEGEVSKTRVVCRSAPGSRSGSMTRNALEDGKEKRRTGYERGRDKKRREEKDRLPSLARTQVEGDMWDRSRNDARSRAGPNNSNRYLSGWGADADSDGGPSASEEDEEEGELDLARILVPPKRQNSIKSLRKHLAADGAGPSAASQNAKAALNGLARPGTRAGRGMSVGSVAGSGVTGGSGLKSAGVPNTLQRRPTEEDWDGESQEEWGGGWVRKGPGSRGRTGLVGSGRSGAGKSRLGINGPWALIGGGS
ncbi:hypothetical protein B0H34DRAFT_658329, partial [Crassisporium funariophilum]